MSGRRGASDAGPAERDRSGACPAGARADRLPAQPRRPRGASPDGHHAESRPGAGPVHREWKVSCGGRVIRAAPGDSSVTAEWAPPRPGAADDRLCAPESASATVSTSWPSAEPAGTFLLRLRLVPRGARGPEESAPTARRAGASPPTSSASPHPAPRRPDLTRPTARTTRSRRATAERESHADHRHRRRRGRVPHRGSGFVPRGARGSSSSSASRKSCGGSRRPCGSAPSRRTARRRARSRRRASRRRDGHRGG